MNFFGSCLYFTFRFLNLSLKLFEATLLILSLFDISIFSPGSSFKLFFCFISSSIILSFSQVFVLKVSLFLLISYERQKEESCLANEEVDQFQKYLESLDDDLFIDVCEYLGQLEVHKIQECLESGKLETVRAGIAKFKMALSDIAKKRIEQLKAYV